MKSDIKLIGIGGLPRSGKDTLADVFIANGYYGVSIGDIVRDEARKRHASAPDPISVENMTETSNHLREINGPEFALIIALERYKKEQETQNHKGLVAFSIRMPIETDFILENGGDIIWIESSDDVRYKRYLEHLREGEVKISKTELLKQESLQWRPQEGIDPKIQMNVEYVKNHATHVFENEHDNMVEFHQKANIFINKF